MIENEYNPDSVSPPGDTVLECLRADGDSMDVVWESDLSSSEWLTIIIGTRRIEQHEAEVLEASFGSHAAFWLKRQADYDAAKSRLSTDCIDGEDS